MDEILKISIQGDTTEFAAATKQLDSILSSFENSLGKTQVRLTSFQSSLNAFGTNAGVISQNSQKIVDSIQKLADATTATFKPIKITTELQEIKMPAIPVLKVPVQVEKIDIVAPSIPVIKVPLEAENLVIPQPSIPTIQIPTEIDTAQAQAKLNALDAEPIRVVLNTEALNQELKVRPVEVPLVVGTENIREQLQVFSQAIKVDASVSTASLDNLKAAVESAKKDISSLSLVPIKLKVSEIEVPKPQAVKIPVEVAAAVLPQIKLEPVKVDADTTAAQDKIENLIELVKPISLKLTADNIALESTNLPVKPVVDVSDINRQIEDAIKPVTVPINVGEVELPEVDKGVTIPVDADTEPAQNKIEAISGKQVVIPVVTDTTSARQSVENLNLSVKPINFSLNTGEAESNLRRLQNLLLLFEQALSVATDEKDVKSLTEGIEELRKKIVALGGTPLQFKGFEQGKKTLADLQAQFVRFQEGLSSAKSVESFERIQRALNATALRMNNFVSQGGGAANVIKNLGHEGGNAEGILKRLDNVIRDFSSGGKALESQISNLIEGFIHLRKESGSTKSALSSIGAEFLSGGGLAIGLSVGVGLLISFVEKLFEADEGVDVFEAGMTALNATLDVTKNRLDSIQDALDFSNRLGSINTKLAGLKESVDISGQVTELREKLLEVNDTVSELSAKKVNIAVTIEGFTGLDEESKDKIKKSFNLGDVTDAKALEGLKKQLEAVTQAYDDAAKKQTQLQQTQTALQLQLRLQHKEEADKDAKDALDAAKKAADDLKRLRDSLEFNFFDKFFKVFPASIADKAKQVVAMASTALEFASKNASLFVGLDDILKVRGDDQKVIEKGKIFWDNFQKGIVKFKPPSVKPIDILQEVNITPDVKTEDPSVFVNQYISSIQDALSAIRVDFNAFRGLKDALDIPNKTQILDLYKTKFAQIGQKLPELIKIKNELGKTVIVPLSAVFNTKQLSDGLQDGFSEAEKIMQSFGDALQNAMRGIATAAFVGVGEAIAGAITGSGIGEALQKFGSFFGSALATLGEQMIALSPIIQSIQVALSSLNPALLLPAGIALVALGNIIKSHFANAFAFSKGGKVPGSGDRDTVPALLTPGEIVLTKQQARDYEQGIKQGLFGLGDTSKFTTAIQTFTTTISTQLQALGVTATSTGWRFDGLKIQAPTSRNVQMIEPAPLVIEKRTRGADEILRITREQRRQRRGG